MRCDKFSLKFLRFFYALSVVLTLFTQTALYADGLDDRVRYQVSNITSVEDADRYARELVKKYEEENHTKITPESPAIRETIFIYHLGDDLPKETKWLITHLEDAGFKVEIKLETRNTFEELLEKEKIASNNLLHQIHYKTDDEAMNFAQEAALKESADVQSRASLFVRRLFGVPNGFSFIFRVKNATGERAFYMKNATIQALLAGTNVGVSVYVKTLTGVDMHVIQPVIASMSWTWLNMYQNKMITSWFSQGKQVMLADKGLYKVAMNPLTMRLGVFFRSMIGNAIFMSAAFGFDDAFSEKGLALSVVNSATGLFARFWFEEWLTAKQGTILKDGTLLIEEGQFSMKKAATIRGVFEFLNGVAKTMNLLQVPYVSWIFPASGFYGVIRTVYVKRYDYSEKIRKKALALLGRAKSYTHCTTLFVKRSP